jgi:hypothetical protein
MAHAAQCARVGTHRQHQATAPFVGSMSAAGSRTSPLYDHEAARAIDEGQDATATWRR